MSSTLLQYCIVIDMQIMLTVVVGVVVSLVNLQNYFACATAAKHVQMQRLKFA